MSIERAELDVRDRAAGDIAGFKERVLQAAIQRGLIGDRQLLAGFVDTAGVQRTIDSLVAAFPSHFHHMRKGRVTINAVYSLVDAVKRGHGIHAGPRWAFQAAIEEGAVVEVLPGYSQRAMIMSAIWAPAVMVPARIRAFVDFAATEVRKIAGMEY